MLVRIAFGGMMHETINTKWGVRSRDQRTPY